MNCDSRFLPIPKKRRKKERILEQDGEDQNDWEKKKKKRDKRRSGEGRTWLQVEAYKMGWRDDVSRLGWVGLRGGV